MKRIECVRPSNVNRLKNPKKLLTIGRTIRISKMQTLNHCEQTLLKTLRRVLTSWSRQKSLQLINYQQRWLISACAWHLHKVVWAFGFLSFERVLLITFDGHIVSFEHSEFKASWFEILSPCWAWFLSCKWILSRRCRWSSFRIFGIFGSPLIAVSYRRSLISMSSLV